MDTIDKVSWVLCLFHTVDYDGGSDKPSGPSGLWLGIYSVVGLWGGVGNGSMVGLVVPGVELLGELDKPSGAPITVVDGATDVGWHSCYVALGWCLSNDATGVVHRPSGNNANVELGVTGWVFIGTAFMGGVRV